MTEYRVTWVIDVDADTPEDAARKAREYQIDPDSTANVFDVVNREIPEAKPVRIDLQDLDQSGFNDPG